MMTLFMLESQSVFAQFIGPGYIPTTHRSNWHTSGVTSNNPPVADQILYVEEILEDNPGWNLRQAIDFCLNAAETDDEDDVLLVIFGNEYYYLNEDNGFDDEIDIEVNNIIFQGAGNGTVLINEIYDGSAESWSRSAFRITGEPDPGFDPVYLDAPFEKKSKEMVVTSTVGLTPDNWIHIYVENFHEHPMAGDNAQSWARVGQIARISGINGSTLELEDEANMQYLESYGYHNGVEVKPIVKKIVPVEMVGFENFKIKQDNIVPAPDGVFEGYHFDFEYASNCWVRGVYSYFPARAHIMLDKSARIEISGCYIDDAVHHGSGGYGYGVILEKSTSNCRIENNVLRNLRHAVLIQAGANGNVISYNYTSEGKWSNDIVGTDPREIVFHGGYPFANLVEHNHTSKMGPDDHNGDNGPYNAIVRNLILPGSNFVIFENSLLVEHISELSLLGNVVYRDTDYSPSYPPSSSQVEVDRFGKDNSHVVRDHRFANYLAVAAYNMEDGSYAYTVNPTFASGYDFPAIGPWYVPTQNIIPAYDRYNNSNTVTYNNKPTPNAVSISTISNAFGGGVIGKVDLVSDVPSGTTYEWPVGSARTIEAKNQHWPDVDNFYRKFEIWTDPYGQPHSSQEHSFNAPATNGTFEATFKSRVNIDLDIILLNGGGGGGIALDGTSLTLPYSGQHFLINALTLEAEEFSTTVNGISVNYHLGHWSDESVENPRAEGVAHIDLTAYMKGDKVSDSENATLGSNGYKIAHHPLNGDELHMTYIDNGEVYYSASSDGGITWSKDIYIDGGSNATPLSYTCKNPSLSVDKQGNVHIVYEREEDWNPDVRYSVMYVEIDNDYETGIHKTELASSSGNYYGFNNSTMPTIHVEYNLEVFVAWRRSSFLGLTPDLIMQHRSAADTWMGNPEVVPNTDIDCISPTISYGNLFSNELNLFWVDTQSDAVYHANPDLNWNWGSPDNLTLDMPTISNFKNTSVHQDIGGNPDEIYLVWEGVEEQVEPSAPIGSKQNANIKTGNLSPVESTCPPATQDIPVIIFKEHKGGSAWEDETIFRVNNTCDRKPVVTSWYTQGPREVMIAFEKVHGKIHTVLKRNGQWTNLTQVTSNGSNPSLTNPGDLEPNLIYTHYSTDPHQIKFNNDLLPPPSAPIKEKGQNPENTALPHSRLLRFELDNHLRGSDLNMEGSVVLEIGDPELQTIQGTEIVFPQYIDSLITIDNVFEYTNISLLNNIGASLRIPVSIKAVNLSRQSGREHVSLPMFNLKLFDSLTRYKIKDIREYDTDILGNGSFYQERDTIVVDLSDVVSPNFYLSGEVSLNRDTWKQNIAEVYDLRNVEGDSLEGSMKPSILAEDIPKKFTLYQNYPNPFNPSTTIKFDLPKDIEVTIKVFDVLGRLVSSIVDKKMKAGTHKVIWDGRSQTGQEVASGFYFYRIQAAEFTNVKKLLLIK